MDVFRFYVKYLYFIINSLKNITSSSFVPQDVILRFEVKNSDFGNSKFKANLNQGKYVEDFNSLQFVSSAEDIKRSDETFYSSTKINLKDIYSEWFNLEFLDEIFYHQVSDVHNRSSI